MYTVNLLFSLGYPDPWFGRYLFIFNIDGFANYSLRHDYKCHNNYRDRIIESTCYCVVKIILNSSSFQHLILAYDSVIIIHKSACV